MTSLREKKIFLSPPEVTNADLESVRLAMQSGWVAPIGPDLEAFENELAAICDRGFAVGLASGTAAIHLGLKALGVESGSEVLVPTLTFAATAFAVIHAGGIPTFIDVEETSWNLDAALLCDYLSAQAKSGALPKAVVTVDIFGRTANYGEILPICQRYGVPVLADSAEALGASFERQPAGSLGDLAVLSFNGNKIITTSGGGALLTDDPAIAQSVRKWSTQARESLPWYEHHEIGYNYRLSNILASLGRSQLARLSQIVEQRRWIRNLYAQHFESEEAITVECDPPWGRSNAWLTTVRFDGAALPAAAERVRVALAAEDIEARPIWKPMHQQPVFRDRKSILSGGADMLFSEGLCLPSGGQLCEADIKRISDIVLRECHARR